MYCRRLVREEDKEEERRDGREEQWTRRKRKKRKRKEENLELLGLASSNDNAFEGDQLADISRSWECGCEIGKELSRKENEGEVYIWCKVGWRAASGCGLGSSGLA